MNAPKHCYLCGRLLHGPKPSKDHCPPKALFAKKLRHNLKLITLPVHKDCNASYAYDEQYFKATMFPLARGSVAGEAIFHESIEKAHDDAHRMTLATKIYREFEERPSGLYLPAGRVLKRQEGARITRVAWKIVRGLNFHHHGTILKEDHSRVVCHETPPGQEPSDVLQAMTRHPDDETHGQYSGVFDYRFRVKDLEELNYWAFLLWDRIIIEVLFHNPWSCQCIDCTADLVEIKNRMGERGIQLPTRTQSNSK